MMHRPSELIAFLKSIGASPKKSLSQNFLIDGNIVRKIVSFANIKPADTVVEIGPGPGVLTEELLSQGAHVIAIEKDKKFASSLIRLQTPDNRLQVFEADALSFSYPEIRCKLVSNLPYQITTPLLGLLLPLKNSFESLTLMVQKEVAARMCAAPATHDYSSLSLFIQFYSTPHKGFTVEPTCFYPRPTVQSSVLKLTLKTPPKVSSEAAFFAMTRKAFQHRRKMIRASLKATYPLVSIDRGLEKAGKNLKARPEELALDDFLILFQEIEKEQPHLR
jgi:16S rRNA (adenine1518-N6/adenine1519-N6)-dimethyltransferase